MRASHICVIAFLMFGGVARADDAAIAAQPMKLAGTWKGVFTYGTGVYAADLELSDADRGPLTGEFHFKSLIMPPERARVLPPVEGTWKVTATLDDGSRTLTIAPGPWVKQPLQPVVPLQTLASVYVAGRDELAGHMLARIEQPGIEHQYFLFTRGGDGADRAQAVEKIQKLTEHAALALAPPTRPNRRNAEVDPVPQFPDKLDHAALKAWIERYETEYPGSPQRDGVDLLGAKGMPLLNDATFKPVFGETFDAIDIRELRQIIDAVMCVGPPNAPKFKDGVDRNFTLQYGYIQYILKPTAQRIIAVAAMREIDQWEAESLERFKKEPATAHTFDDMAATQKAITQRVAYAWPSDIKRTNDAIEQLRTASSGSALTASADKAIESAAGFPGAKALANWSKQNANALAHAPVPERTSVLEKVNSALDKILVQLLQRYESDIANFGAGRDALQVGVKWRAALMQDFAFAADRPSVIELQRKLIERRKKDLLDAQAALLEQVSLSKSQADLDLLFSRDIPFDGDKESTAYTAVAAAAKQRQAKLEEDRLMTMFSADEKKMMDHPGHIDVSKYAGYAPSAEEVRLAILRGYAFGNGQMIDAFTARHGGVIYPINMGITEVRVQKFIPIDGTKDFDYLVKLTWKFSLPKDNVIANYDKNTAKGSDLAAKFDAAVANAIDDDYEYKLRLYDDGWGVPELRAAGAGDAVMTQFLKGELKNVPRGR